MKIFLVLMLLVSNAFSAKQSGGGDEGHNGGGMGEYSFLFVKANLKQMLADCRLGCGLDVDEDELLASLRTNVLPEVLFKDEKDMGTKLYLIMGTRLWINQDLLWLDTDRTNPYDVAESLSLWIDILSREEVTESLKTKLHQTLRGQILRSGLDSGNDQLVEYLLWKRKNASDAFVIRDPSFQTLDLTVAVHDRLLKTCEGAATTLRFFAPAWMPLPGVVQQGPIITLNFGLKWNCGEMAGNTYARAVVHARSNGHGGWNLEPESLVVYFEGAELK